MNTITIKMLDTSEKKLTCTSGKFVLGINGDNSITRVVFVVPTNFTLINSFVILTTPDRTHNYNIPLVDMSFIVTNTITSISGDWIVTLMLTGSDLEGNIPICISSSIIGYVQESIINVETLETLPVDENMQILYNNMLSLYNSLQDTLATLDLETLEQIEQDLSTILNGMSEILAIDWSALAGLSNMGQDLQDIKLSLSGVSNQITNLTIDISSILTKNNSILDKIGTSTTSITLFKNLEDIYTLLSTNVINKLNTIQLDVTAILGETSILKNDTATLKNDTLNIISILGTINDTLETI